MKVIKELSYIINRNEIRITTILGDGSAPKKTKLYQLYKICQKPEVKTDEDAAYLMYGERKTSNKYRKLKSNLVEKLFDTLLFIDVNQTSGEREFVYHTCWKNWAINRIATKYAAIDASERIALKVFNLAVKYEFSDLVIVISLYLRNLYALKRKDPKKFEQYNEYYHKYHKIAYYENLVDEYYHRLILDHTLKSIIPEPQIKEDAEKYYAELVEVAKDIPTIRFQCRLYSIRILGCMGVFDYRQTKEIVIMALQHLEGYPTFTNNFKRGLLLQKIVCHIQLREFAEGKVAAEECRKLLAVGTFNWFKAHEQFFMLAIKTGNYQEAYLTEKTISQHSQFKNLSPYMQQMWRLYYGYIHFLVRSGIVRPLEQDKRFTTFKLNKFLNNIPQLALDKRGMNIPVLILHSAFLLLQNKQDEAIDRIEAIEKYRGRYVKKDDPNYRSDTFIKMMQEISKGGFDANIIEKKVRRYVKNLEDVPFDMTIQPHETEVFPYEVMWNWMLEMMRHNTTQHNTTQHNTTQHNTTQHNTTQHNLNNWSLLDAQKYEPIFA